MLEMLTNLSAIGAFAKKVVSFMKQLKDCYITQKEVQTKPELRLLMLGCNIFQLDGAKHTGIALHTKIWNTGAPSPVIDWSLMVIPQKGTPTSAHLRLIPEEFPLGSQSNPQVLRSSDALDLKVKIIEIGRTSVEGQLLFCVNLPQDIVMDPSTRLELTATDIYETKTTPTVKLIRDF